MNGNKFVNEEEKLDALVSALQSNNAQIIENAKFSFLWEAANLFEVIINYIFLEKIGVHFDFGSSTVKKGTKFYRIRSYRESVDYSNPSEWLPSPHKKQNRANRLDQEALYLGSSETLCCLETHLAFGEKYAVGIYECLEDFEVGGYTAITANNRQYILAAMLLNAFLIAPSRVEKNRELFEVLDAFFGRIDLNDLSDIRVLTDPKDGLNLPFKFAVLNRSANLYNLTNQLCDAISASYPNGIRYSSCYFPAEAPGIVCSEYNIVLYSSAMNKVKFRKHEIKTFTTQSQDGIVLSCANVVKAYLGVADK